jgi:DNA-binding MarR family transcriptional regulator
MATSDPADPHPVLPDPVARDPVAADPVAPDSPAATDPAAIHPAQEPVPGGRVAGERQDLVDALVRASFAVMAVLNRVGAEHDLSLTQIRVLAILRDRQVRISELADYLGLDKSTISGLVDRAEKRGLLRREPDPADKRAVDVLITGEGTRLADIGAAEIAGSLSAMTGKLTAAEARRLTALLEQMIAEP